MLNLPLVNEEERALIIKAKEALRQGRFQNYKETSISFRGLKITIKTAVVLEKVIEILKAIL